MAKEKNPVTAAVRVLREHGVAFTHHPYAYEERGGTAVSARELGVPEHQCIKTLVMRKTIARNADDRADARRPRSVDQKLARAIGVKLVVPCAPAVADRHSGYQVGGTSPFGTRRAMPVYLQATIADLPYLYVNGGHQGYLVGMPPAELCRVLSPVLVDIAA